MRDFVGQALVILGLIASIVFGIAVGWKGTWLSVATLTLICLVLAVYVNRLEQYGEPHSEWWEIAEICTLFSTFFTWGVAVVIEPVYRLLTQGVIRIGIDSFVR